MSVVQFYFLVMQQAKRVLQMKPLMNHISNDGSCQSILSLLWEKWWWPLDEIGKFLFQLVNLII